MNDEIEFRFVRNKNKEIKPLSLNVYITLLMYIYLQTKRQSSWIGAAAGVLFNIVDKK